MVHEHVKELLEQKKLTFKGDHSTNLTYLFKNGEESFIKALDHSLRWVMPGDEEIITSKEYCFACGERIEYTLQGSSFIPNESSCFQQTMVEVTIPIPSGVLLLDDWLGDASTVLDHLDKGQDINCQKGTALRVTDYAGGDVIHFYVGNNSPQVYEHDGVLYFGRDTLDEEDNSIPLVNDGNLKGRVTTDLWWVTGCDRDVYEQLAISKFGEKRGREVVATVEEKCDVVVHVEPGTYKLKYFLIHNGEENLYATLTRVE